MRHVHFLSVLVALVVWQSSVSATVHNVGVNLDGSQEVGPVATTGTGFASVSFDDVSGAMSVIGTFSNLIGTSNNAHVHGYSGFGVNSGAIISLTFDFGVTSGNFSGNGIIPAGNIDDVMDGLTYINIHSSFRPGGEIRGQIIVPEPATASLVCLGGLLLAARRRR